MRPVVGGCAGMGRTVRVGLRKRPELVEASLKVTSRWVRLFHTAQYSQPGDGGYTGQSVHTGSIPGLNCHSLKGSAKEPRGRIGMGARQPMFEVLREASSHRATSRGKLFSQRMMIWMAGQKTCRDHAAMPNHKRDCAFEHPVQRVVERQVLRVILHQRQRGLNRVAIERFAVQASLAAKGGVETWRGNPYRIGQHRQRQQRWLAENAKTRAPQTGRKFPDGHCAVPPSSKSPTSFSTASAQSGPPDNYGFCVESTQGQLKLRFASGKPG